MASGGAGVLPLGGSLDVGGAGSLMTSLGFGYAVASRSFSSSIAFVFSTNGGLDGFALVLPLLDWRVGFVGVSALRFTNPLCCEYL